MKKIYNLWILALILIGAGACTSEVDDVFDQSAANRINQSIAEYQEVLRSAGNGWVLITILPLLRLMGDTLC